MLGPLRLQLESCTVETLISAAIAQLTRTKSSTRRDAAEHLPVLGIDIRLSRLALQELLNNALKYSPRLTPIQIAAEHQQGCVVIRVSNTGPGIPEHEQARIFDKFYRAHGLREQIMGTGLGPTIVRNIIEAHGGRLWVKSKPGAGAEFVHRASSHVDWQLRGHDPAQDEITTSTDWRGSPGSTIVSSSVSLQ